ncbi:LysR family transcriptional regulator [Planctomonas sp. JC2975]|uniref:LysR family transcriptional regulator n=1 Tax=Planctomonas sp. JC2975 TaxID=2729626 RepID=UPI001475C639|nr:LysR family transcriptional regulator [Planctomonas sp. JC2975]NNC12278.1 LysR family transcriptional regulator [Planctomonas sp. JC2975]
MASNGGGQVSASGEVQRFRGAERWPDLAVLELLVAVSEHGSLSAGARAVGMAQPNASRAVAAWEKSLGVRVLERSPRGSRLTADGDVVVDWASGVLDAATRLRTAVDALRREQNSHLTVAASLTVAEHLIPVWLTALRREYPDLDVGLLVHNSSEVFDLVRAERADVGFVETPRIPRDVRRMTVAHDRLVVVVAPSHPWAKRTRPLGPAELAATPLVVREAGSGTRNTLEDALAHYQRPVPALELTSNAAVRVAVASGAGAAVLSELAVESAVRSGDLVEVPLHGLDLARSIHAVWTDAATLHATAAELVRIARRRLAA